MYPPPFDGCWDRIRRARAHRERFGALWGEFLDEHPYNPFLHIEDDGEGWIGAQCEPLPLELPLILGEMLYQLRAALDSAVYATAVAENDQDPPPKERDLEFPICDTCAKFKKAAWHIKPLSDEARGFIESVQPCNASHYPEEARVLHRSLDMLNDWARKDRHRRLHIVGSWASSADPILRGLPDGVTLDYMCARPDGMLENDSEVATFKLSGYTREMSGQIEANPNLMIDIAADEEPPPRDADDTLGVRTGHMVTAAAFVVTELAKLCGFPNSERESEVGRDERP